MVEIKRTHIPKPEAGEFPPYASMYIDLIPDDGRVLEHLRDNMTVVQEHIKTLPSEKLATPHAEGEWTVKEILVHIMDDERIYAYRALRFARGDSTELPGFEQDDYVPPSKANERDLDEIFKEYQTIRWATITLFNYLDDDALLRGGVASGNYATVRALAYHIAGHEMHHLNSIKQNYG